MHFSHRTGTLVAAAVLSLSLTACDFSGVNDAIDGFKVIIGLEEIATPVSVRFVDASTGELIASNVELTFAGADADAIVDLFNDPIASGKARFTGGVAAFGIANDLTPSPGDPVSLRLTARASGYEPQVKSMQLTHEGRQSVVIRLLPEGHAPEGGSATRMQIGSADNGTVTESINVSTPPSAESGGSATLRVEAGTVVRSAGGSLLSGALTTSVTFAAAGNRASLASLPGGFHADVAGGNDGALTSVGFATITLRDAEGTRAKSFTRPIEIGVDIRPGTLNPRTGAPVAAGDELDVFSFDVEEGVWQREGQASIVESGGQLRARFNAEHLSTWSVGATVPTCQASFRITTNGNSVTSIRVWNDFYSETFSIPSNMQQLEELNVTQAVPVGAAFQYEIKGSTTYTGSVADACAGVDVTLPAAVQTGLVTIESSVAPCPAGQSLKAGYEGAYGIEVAEVVAGKADWEGAQTATVDVVTDGNVILGKASLVVRAGTDYRVQGSFNEEEITGSFSTPASIAAGEIIQAEIDNQITNDIAADACE